MYVAIPHAQINCCWVFYWTKSFEQVPHVQQWIRFPIGLLVLLAEVRYKTDLAVLLWNCEGGRSPLGVWVWQEDTNLHKSRDL